MADIRAVGENVWNGWKAALMRDLYTRTREVLLGADAASLVALHATTRAEELAETLRCNPNWDAASITAHIDQFPTRYWQLFDRAGYVRYANLFAECADSPTSPMLFCLTPDLPRRATELAVITSDRPGLFALISGGIVAAGASIVDARITTRKDGLTLDVLWLQDQDQAAITDAVRLKQIEQSVRWAISGSLNIDAAINRRWRQTPSRIRQRPVQARVLINNALSQTHSVLEINGKDAPGLLYRLASALAEMGVQIQMASVSTYGDRVVDVFYIKDEFGLKISQPVRQQRIRQRLLHLLEDSDPANKIASQ